MVSARYPVTKVVKLLKDMQATLQKEMETDQEVQDALRSTVLDEIT